MILMGPSPVSDVRTSYIKPETGLKGLGEVSVAKGGKIV
jgi:hypothetical protein